MLRRSWLDSEGRRRGRNDIRSVTAIEHRRPASGPMWNPFDRLGRLERGMEDTYGRIFLGQPFVWFFGGARRVTPPDNAAIERG